jgi:hypothetical protein
MAKASIIALLELHCNAQDWVDADQGGGHGGYAVAPRAVPLLLWYTDELIQAGSAALARQQGLTGLL